VQHVNAQGTGDTVNGALGVYAYLHKGSSRSYPGRPVQQAADVLVALCVVTQRVFGQESAEAIVGEGGHLKGKWGLETNQMNRKVWKTHPAEEPYESRGSRTEL
jgi:hypothetical protein